MSHVLPFLARRRAAFVLALVMLAVPLMVALSSLTSTAAAHSGNYCGHSSTSHWGWFLWAPWKHVVAFQNHWYESGSHYHQVKVNDGYGSYETFHKCF